MSDKVISDAARLAATAIKALGKDATEVGIGLCIDAALRDERRAAELEIEQIQERLERWEP